MGDDSPGAQVQTPPPPQGTDRDEPVATAASTTSSHAASPQPTTTPQPPNPAPLAHGRVYPRAAGTAPSSDDESDDGSQATTRAKGKGRPVSSEPPQLDFIDIVEKTQADARARRVHQDKLRALEDRKRILARIAADKAERKARAEEERRNRAAAAAEALEAAEAAAAARIASAAGPSAKAAGAPVAKAAAAAAAAAAATVEDGGSSATTEKAAAPSQRPTQAHIKVRLFDGSSAHETFPASATLAGEVRRWVNKQLVDYEDYQKWKKKAPRGFAYQFRVILSPLPNVIVEDSEELVSLEDLGLCPSATLVLVLPVIPEKVPSKNPVLRLATAVANWFVWLFAIITGIILTFFGRRLAVPEPVAANHAGRDNVGGQKDATATGADRRGTGSGTGIKIRRLHDQDAQKDYQLYNGNSVCFPPTLPTENPTFGKHAGTNARQLNFEPRPDEEDEK